MSRIPIRWLRWRIGILLVAAASVGAAYFQSRPTPFDQTLWSRGEKSADANEAPRLRMADGLVDSGVLLGKSEQEIESMLGHPTETGYFRNFDRVYWLGPERGLFSVDSEWLVIRFDGGKVIEARIVRD